MKQLIVAAAARYEVDQTVHALRPFKSHLIESAEIISQTKSQASRHRWSKQLAFHFT
jgi:hypothetical protein